MKPESAPGGTAATASSGLGAMAAAALHGF